MTPLDPVVADERERGGVSGKVHRRPVHGEQAVVPEKQIVHAIGVEGIEHRTEHGGVDLGAALADSGRGDFKAGCMGDLV